ncbi:MAG: sugar phosphate isomerase/epimerase family protein [Chitinophagaceae bacterium]
MLNRRNLLQLLGATAGLSLLPRVNLALPKAVFADSFIYCLNMATIRGHKLGFVKELEVASKAGFHAVEIWMDTLQAYLDGGGTLKDAKTRLDDLGVKVENSIGFTDWIVNDDAARAKGLEQMKKEMDILAQIGCKRTAAPPKGATDLPLLDLKQVADRYRTVLELGDKSSVVPHLELWGFSKNLGRTSEVAYVALESGHPSARILLDIFHLYKGGSSMNTLSFIGKPAVEILHMNDYPADKPAAVVVDADRVYPGDGVAPIRKVLEILKSQERPLVLSFEVFNKTYYAQDPLLVTKTALAKMKAVTKGL